MDAIAVRTGFSYGSSRILKRLINYFSGQVSWSF